MKKIVTLMIILVITGCNSQEKKKEQEKNEEKKITTIKPKEKWDVKRAYDEYGNLIKYDSVYSWSYSNVKGDSIQVNLDSIMDLFKGYFVKDRTFEWNDDFYYFPKNDSLFKRDFFSDDYFFRNWQYQLNEFESIIKQMDSSRNAFLRKFHPGLMESRKQE